MSNQEAILIEPTVELWAEFSEMAREYSSARVIEKNGGRLGGQAVWKISGKLISRYWVEL